MPTTTPENPVTADLISLAEAAVIIEPYTLGVCALNLLSDGRRKEPRYRHLVPTPPTQGGARHIRYSRADVMKYAQALEAAAAVTYAARQCSDAAIEQQPHEEVHVSLVQSTGGAVVVLVGTGDAGLRLTLVQARQVQRELSPAIMLAEARLPSASSGSH